MNRRELLKLLAALPLAGSMLPGLLAKIPVYGPAAPAGLTLAKVLEAKRLLEGSFGANTARYVVLNPDVARRLTKQLAASCGVPEPVNALTEFCGLQVVTNSFLPEGEGFTLAWKGHVSRRGLLLP